VPPKRVPYFKASKELLAALNRRAAAVESEVGRADNFEGLVFQVAASVHVRRRSHFPHRFAQSLADVGLVRTSRKRDAELPTKPPSRHCQASRMGHIGK
jgi:hypothetical protein